MWNKTSKNQYLIKIAKTTLSDFWFHAKTEYSENSVISTLCLPSSTTRGIAKTISRHFESGRKRKCGFLNRAVLGFSEIHFELGVSTWNMREQEFSWQLRFGKCKGVSESISVFHERNLYLISRKINHCRDDIIGGKGAVFVVFKFRIFGLFSCTCATKRKGRFSSLQKKMLKRLKLKFSLKLMSSSQFNCFHELFINWE